MNLTLWSLALLAVGAMIFFGRRKWQRRVETKQYDLIKRQQRAKEDEADRLACLDLGKSLRANIPSSRPEGGAKPGGAANSSG